MTAVIYLAYYAGASLLGTLFALAIIHGGQPKTTGERNDN